MPFAYSLDTINQNLPEQFETIVPSLLSKDGRIKIMETYHGLGLGKTFCDETE